MTTQLQIRRGSTLENDAFVGAEGEITYDFQEKKLHIHDGQTPGGKLIGTNHFAPNIFDCKWADHTLDDPSWLRADMFSWQDGTLYKIAYNHLVDDYTNGTTQSETVSGITINYKRAADGHKIVDASAENSIVSIYNNTNIAWYYILDTENQRFKLPRTRFGFTGIRNTVGNYIAPGLPNITGYTSLAARTASTGYLGGFVNTGGALYASSEVTTSHGLGGGDNSADNKRLNIDASRSNSIYGASTTVQSPATQMYLYFYVGEFIHTPLANKYTNTWISNCVTEIPQDINLELNNGTLTLKAGSKVYVPNGVGVFDEIVIQNDITVSGASTSSNTVRMLYYNNGLLGIYEAHSSGTTPPTTGTNQMFYNMSDNTIKKYTNGSGGVSGFSFPLAVIKDDGTYLYGSIVQVFNGFGYIGRTTFVLPGVKALIPNGRNIDGTLKSTELKFGSVTVRNLTVNEESKLGFLTNSGLIGYGVNDYFESETKPTNFETYATWYDTKNNIIWGTSDGGTTWTQYNRIYLGKLVKPTHLVTENITYFKPISTFNAMSRNDVTNIIEMIYPVGSIYIGTQSTCPISLVIPGSSWVRVGNGKALWGGDGTNGGTTIAAGLPNITGSLMVNSTTRYSGGFAYSSNGAFYPTEVGNPAIDGGDKTANGWSRQNFDASRSSSIYGNSSTVQPPAYVINVWRRTA